MNFPMLTVVCLCSIILWTGACALDNKIWIRYTLENFLTKDERVFNASMVLRTRRQPFLAIMGEAAKKDPRYRFKTKKDAAHGVLITEINGIKADYARERFWAFLRRECGTDCIMLKSTPNYIPYNREHIVHRYETYDVFKRLKRCRPGPPMC